MARDKGTSDYSRIEDYISTIDDQIEFETGNRWDDLSPTEKEDVLLSHFFKGLPQYRSSAHQLRIGLDEIEGRPLDTKGAGMEYNVDTITRGGKKYTVLRNPNGRIRRWVRE